VLAATTMLHRRQDGKDGRLGKAGYAVASIALAAFIPCAIDSLATGNAQALSPVYILAILGSFAGLILFAIGSFRAAQVLPRWAGLLLPLAWLLGGPVGTASFRRATLILTAAYTVIALTLPDSGPESPHRDPLCCREGLVYLAQHACPVRPLRTLRRTGGRPPPTFRFSDGFSGSA